MQMFTGNVFLWLKHNEHLTLLGIELYGMLLRNLFSVTYICVVEFVYADNIRISGMCYRVTRVR